MRGLGGLGWVGLFWGVWGDWVGLGWFEGFWGGGLGGLWGCEAIPVKECPREMRFYKSPKQGLNLSRS